MSDEYANSGFKHSLVNSTAPETVPKSSRNSDYATDNYPPPDDTTSSGGYRSGASIQPNLVDESPTAAGTRTHAEDVDPRREGVTGANEYDAGSMESRAQAEAALAARYREGRT